jgi:hypothetical protein
MERLLEDTTITVDSLRWEKPSEDVQKLHKN